MSDPVRYIVLTEAPDRHHVAVARAKPATGWVQIIATFARHSRAEDYAHIENDMVDDTHGVEWRIEDHDPPPLTDEPVSSLSTISEYMERRSTVETKTVSYTSPSGSQRPMGALSNEVLRELPSLLEEFPKGPTARIIAERLCVEEHFVRRACREMSNEGKAQYRKRLDSPAHHLLPLDYDPPPEELTPAQRAVFAAMSKAARADGIVDIPKRQIAITAGCPTGSIQNVLDSLERKGHLIGVDKNRGIEVPSVYRIVQAP